MTTTTLVEAAGFFFDDYGTCIVYAIVWFTLLIAFLHATCYIVTYSVTLGNVAVYGEKNQDHPVLTRLVAGTFLVLYTCYNAGIYGLLVMSMDFGHAFWRSPWGILDPTLTVILMLEPLALVIVTWLKIKCAIDSWRRAPNEEEVLEAIAQREENKRESNSNPYVTVVMPIYNEPIESLMIAINSVTEVQYPLHRLHLVLAFDSDHVSTLYRAVIYCLQANKADIDYVALSTSKGMDEIGDIGNDFPAVGDIMYRGLMVTPCRFVHGGKRHAQMCAFRYLSDVYAAQATKPLLLFIDSDIELDEFAIAHFTYEMTGQTGVYREALTGLITCKTAGTYSFLKVLQDTEYVESQMLQRNAEDYLGSVSCLPGALTMVRFETLASVASIYFGNMDAVDPFDFNRTHLGEDRYLTHLLMEKRPERYRIGFCPSARCKTEGCDSFRSLLKQRRRWYLGTLMNEVYQLASPILWRQYPGLNGLIGLSALRNGPLFVYVLFLQLMHGQGTWYSYAYAVSVFGAIWMFVIAAGFKIGRLKIAWFYPVVLVCLPVMAAVFQVYGMLTFNVRTWGGPRTAADRASESALDEVVIMPKHDLPQAIADDQEPIGDGDHAAMMGSPM
ncbi:chitin synthase [Plasmodiophora brassicae]